MFSYLIFRLKYRNSENKKTKVKNIKAKATNIFCIVLYIRLGWVPNEPGFFFFVNKLCTHIGIKHNKRIL